MKYPKPIWLAGALLALVVAFAGCKKPAADVLAQVGDRAITVADFKTECDRRVNLHQPLPDRQTLLEQMVDRETCLQQARAAGLQNDAEVRRVSEEILIARYRETQHVPKIKAVRVTPEEIKAAYEKNLAHYTQPAKVKLAILFFALDAKAESDQVASMAARANEALAKATNLPPDVGGFGQLAADSSDDQLTRYRGGDAGWFADDGLQTRWPKEMLAAGFALKEIGALSPVLRGRDGFYLVKKMDARPASVSPLEQVRPTLERRLVLARQQEIASQLNSAARTAAKVTVNGERLATVDYPTQFQAKTTGLPPALNLN